MTHLLVLRQVYTSVIAVALVCCLTGQRQRRDTAVVGDLMVHDLLLPKPVCGGKAGGTTIMHLGEGALPPCDKMYLYCHTPS